MAEDFYLRSRSRRRRRASVLPRTLPAFTLEASSQGLGMAEDLPAFTLEASSQGLGIMAEDLPAFALRAWTQVRLALLPQSARSDSVGHLGEVVLKLCHGILFRGDCGALSCRLDLSMLRALLVLVLDLLELALLFHGPLRPASSLRRTHALSLRQTLPYRSLRPVLSLLSPSAHGPRA